MWAPAVAPCEASNMEVLTRSSAMVCCGGDGSALPIASKIEVLVWTVPPVRKDSPVSRTARPSVTWEEELPLKRLFDITPLKVKVFEELRCPLAWMFWLPRPGFEDR